MKNFFLFLFSFLFFAQYTYAQTPQSDDWRFLPNGNLLHNNGYVDQPYVVILENGNWFCVYTTNAGHEGSKGQHIACRISKDQGKSWGEAVRIEEPGTESASWGMPYLTAYGRLFVFYCYNGDKIHSLGSRKNIREDMLGWYCFKYSDDNGKTWSDRHRLPMRKTALDRMNQWNGEVQIFWGVGKPIKLKKGMMFAFTKVGEYMLEYSEGWYFYCKNIDTQKKIEKLKWELLPDGEEGVRSPDWGDIQAEHNIVQLSNGTLYSMHRTTQGVPLESYSYNKGHSWTDPVPPTDYNGRILKNPRANPKIWRCKNGKYLFWYHNNGTKSFYNRNPAWLSGGIERDGKIIWSQPEIVLYKEVFARGMSYPDLIEQDGKYWFTETEKTEARVHEIPANFLEKLWSQHDLKRQETQDIVVDLDEKEITKLDSVSIKSNIKTGFTVTIRLHKNLDMAVGLPLIDSRDLLGKGFWMEMGDHNSVKFSLSDGTNVSTWNSDKNILQTRSRMKQEVTVIVDLQSKIIHFVADGKVCDGGNYRPFGWGRIEPKTEDVSTNWLKLNQSRKTLLGLEFYNKPKMITEVIGNYRFWKGTIQ